MAEPIDKNAPPFEVRNARLTEIANQLDRIATLLEQLAAIGKPTHPNF